jgi:membrane-associated protease RseP (regulator of RpoE activity)
MDQAAEDKRVREITALVADLFVVDAYYQHQEQLVLSLRYRYSRRKSEKLLRERLQLGGYDFHLSRAEEGLLVSIGPGRKFRIPTLNIILFLATLGTVYGIPKYIFGWDGVLFTIALMSILLVHEMGHYVASRRRGIVTSWPYFIPAPNFIGTFGALIKSKSPFWNRRDLIEVGAAGPIAGWIVALGWLVYGLSTSSIISPELAPIAGMAFSLDGESILIRYLVPVLIGPAPEGSFYLFTEAAFAGWVGLLVTALNMLPIGQLDGGHIVYGLNPSRQVTLGWLALGALVILGFQSPMWWFFAALGFVMGVAHPPTLNDNKPLPLAARIMGWIALGILLVSFTPVPFQ